MSASIAIVAALGAVAMTCAPAEAFVPTQPSHQVTRLVASRDGRNVNDVLTHMKKSDDEEDSAVPALHVQPRSRGSYYNSKKFIRIRPLTVRGSRKCFELQTAVATFERINSRGESQTVDLHAQLHYGADQYFDYYNSKEFSSRYDRVHYELLLDEDLTATRNGLRYLPARSDGRKVLMSSASDASMASQYGLACQVDVVDFSNENWVHADLTRQQLLQQTKTGQDSTRPQDRTGPLWALASTAPTWPGAEAVLALFRPSTPSTPLSSPVTRRLFSNLFLPGNSLAGWLRALFWLALPCPELSVMVLDWSSIVPRPTGGVSQVAQPVLESLLSGNIQEARQLVFGQMVVGAQRASGEETLLIEKRNNHALQVLKTSLDRDGSRRSALLYGGMHCPDLYRKLLGMGFRLTKTHWRTAWSVHVPSFGTGGEQNGITESFAASSSPAALAVGLVILPLYFLVGGADWIGAIGDLATSLEAGHVSDAILDVTLYLFRHVLLYLGLSKFVVEWDGGVNLFGIENR